MGVSRVAPHRHFAAQRQGAGGRRHWVHGSVTESAELYTYDPAGGAGAWNSAGAMSAGRLPTATLLPNGKVLVAGGSTSSGSATEQRRAL